MAEFASNAKGNLAVTLGSIGTGLGVLGGAMGMGNNIVNPFGRPRGIGPNVEDEFVTRYDADKDAKIARLEMDKALLESQNMVDKKGLEIYTYFDSWRRQHEASQNAMDTQQAVYNATNSANISCLQKQIEQLQSMTKMYIPAYNVTPYPMEKFNHWQEPTT